MEIKMSNTVILWAKRNEMKAYLESRFGAGADASVERSQQLVSIVDRSRRILPLLLSSRAVLLDASSPRASSKACGRAVGEATDSSDQK